MYVNFVLRLVHSSSLEEILKRERAYAKVISDMITSMDEEVETLNSTQQKEMDIKIKQLDITTTSDVCKLCLTLNLVKLISCF